MQLVVHCVATRGTDILLLRKPRRGWWVAPGGKVEVGEGLTEAVIREYREETGLTLIRPRIAAVSTITTWRGEVCVDHFMLFTFGASGLQGDLLAESAEGELRFVPRAQWSGLPMAEGDRSLLGHTLEALDASGDEDALPILAAKFVYTEDYALRSWSLEGGSSSSFIGRDPSEDLHKDS